MKGKMKIEDTLPQYIKWEKIRANLIEAVKMDEEERRDPESDAAYGTKPVYELRESLVNDLYPIFDAMIQAGLVQVLTPSDGIKVIVSRDGYRTEPETASMWADSDQSKLPRAFKAHCWVMGAIAMDDHVGLVSGDHVRKLSGRPFIEPKK